MSIYPAQAAVAAALSIFINTPELKVKLEGGPLCNISLIFFGYNIVVRDTTGGGLVIFSKVFGDKND